MAAPLSSQLFLSSLVKEHSDDSNPYYQHFNRFSGRGSSDYASRIGRVYSQVPYYQKGYGYLGGMQNKSGRGVGSFLSSIWKYAAPFLKKGAQTLGTAAVDVASNIATDAIKGKNIKESASENIKTKGSEVLKTFGDDITGLISANKSETDSSPPPELVAPTPTQYRRLSRKRKKVYQKPQKNTPNKKKKYTALQYM
jgi:hypothetical protein